MRRGLFSGVFAVTAGVVTMAFAVGAGAATLPPGFQESIVFSGLDGPTALRFSPDGRVFVAEKSGRILVYSGLGDSTPTVFADLSTNVYNSWERGLLSIALDPGFPASPFVYALYTHDAEIGGVAPRWGRAGVLSDPCPTPPGAMADGCVASGRLSRLEASGDTMTGPEQVLVEGWCQQYPSHSMGDIRFDADGALYASAGDGASFTFADYGQDGSPPNPCGDPPAGVGGAQSPPTAEGGALRSQDLRTEGDPVGLNGTVIRVDRTTGEAWPANPNFLHPDPNARRIFAYGLRNPFRFVVGPDGSDLWVGNVGWYWVDEIDRVSLSGPGVYNSGWPCYEGSGRMWEYDVLDLDICQELYSEPSSTSPPYFAYGSAETPAFPPTCSDGGTSISGLAFYGGPSYPGYEGSLFVADYARDCIWLLPPDENGDPDPDAHEIFGTGLAGPVDLEVGPGGDLFYVDINSGTIRRIRYVAGNSPPNAVADATPASGSAPLTVTLDASGSNDPDAEVLTYAWDLDGDGQYDDAFQPTIQHTYATRGRYTARVRVTDSLGESSTAAVVVLVDASPPVAQIDAPAASTSWQVGDVLTFSGSAHDEDEGALPPSALRWRLILQHCPSGCHSHFIETWDGVAGGSFVAPDHEYPSYLELELTATDSDGATDTTVRRLDPQSVELTFATSPTGFELLFGGYGAAAPFTQTAIVGSRPTLTAPSPQTRGGYPYLFDSWSDGGGRTHEVVVPETPTTYTASFSSPPVANGDGYSVREDGMLTVPAPGVLSNDADPDTSSLTAVVAQTAKHGALDLSSNGAFTYRPDPNFSGSDTFSYKANDGRRDSNIATITIAVTPVNDPPVAAPDSYSVAEDGQLTAGGVLDNDADVDGQVLKAVVITAPAAGTLDLRPDGSFVYVPKPDFNGVDSFTYRANDGADDSSAATVTINVAAVNDAPSAANDGYAAKQSTMLTVAAPGVLANDVDVEGDALGVVAVTPPRSGALRLNPNGSFTYTPTATTVGRVSFSYKTSDGALESNVATVAIDVSAAQPPRRRAQCVVPALIGRTLVAARRVALRARCRLGRVSWANSRAPKSRVLKQRPRAGRRLPAQAKIAVVVSRGPKTKR